VPPRRTGTGTSSPVGEVTCHRPKYGVAHGLVTKGGGTP
jgi:hypothetical protein